MKLMFIPEHDQYYGLLLILGSVNCVSNKPTLALKFNTGKGPKELLSGELFNCQSLETYF